MTITAERDGSLTLDVDESNDRVLSVTIHGDGSVGFSALWDGKSSFGTLEGKLPTWVVKVLRLSAEAES